MGYSSKILSLKKLTCYSTKEVRHKTPISELAIHINADAISYCKVSSYTLHKCNPRLGLLSLCAIRKVSGAYAKCGIILCLVSPAHIGTPLSYA